MSDKSGRFPALGLFNHASVAQLTPEQLINLTIAFRERGLLREFASKEAFDMFFQKAVAGFEEIRRTYGRE